MAYALFLHKARRIWRGFKWKISLAYLLEDGTAVCMRKRCAGPYLLVTGCLSALRFHNKGVYVKVGLQKISHTRNLHKDIKLQVDQHEVELPSIEGLIFINIPR